MFKHVDDTEIVTTMTVRPSDLRQEEDQEDQMKLAYEAGLRRGWSAHRTMEPVFPFVEFEKWLAKRKGVIEMGGGPGGDCGD